jgi:hypothetical protein
MKNVKPALFPILCINEVHIDFYAAQFESMKVTWIFMLHKKPMGESMIEIGIYDWLLPHEPLF